MNVNKFNVHGEEITVEDTQARATIGDLTTLETTNKNSVVEAINEVKNTKNIYSNCRKWDKQII